MPAVGEGEATAAALIAELSERGLTAATAESLTGGMLAAAITAVPGASAVFRGGVVAYATPVKGAVLGVPGDVLSAHGPVASTTAAAMAEAGQRLFGANLAIATTGVAGPDPVGSIPPGAAFVAAVLDGSEPQVRRLHLAGDRQEVRSACTQAGLELGLQLVRTG